jgi:hypothetical protein
MDCIGAYSCLFLFTFVNSSNFPLNYIRIGLYVQRNVLNVGEKHYVDLCHRHCRIFKVLRLLCDFRFGKMGHIIDNERILRSVACRME